MNKLTFFTLSFAFVACFTQVTLAQENIPLQPKTRPLIGDSTTKQTTKKERKAMKEADVKKLLDSRRFTFVAQYANPLGGGTTTLNGRTFNITPDGSGHVYLNYNYDLKVRPDSVIAYLPYYGRTTFAAGYNNNSNDSGVMFTSTKFNYTYKTGKKGNTVISITPQDAKYNRNLYLDVSASGRAQLQVIITNRNTISYDGYIVEDKK
jgi:hypothetical protein